jgi:exodeoxyribonuclease V alpha subunit
MELDPKQREAVEACCDVSNRVVAITGPAGTGKTTILQMVFQNLEAAGYRVGLCAPTGKAAKRIFEATGIDAMTVHRLLEYTHPGDPDPKTGKACGVSMPKRNRQNPLDLDVVLCDEYAMVNHEVGRAIFDALPPGGRICVFGDDNQLAPIEEDKRLMDEPSPFLKLLANPKFKSVHLDTIFRQGADSGILLNANLIIKGRYPTKNEQWDQIVTDKPVDVLRDYVLDQWTENEVDFGAIENQIIVPQQKGWVGATALNTMIQGLFHNEHDPCIYLDRKPWMEGEGGKKGGKIRVYLGDKVICTSNLHDLGVFNGETGKVIEISDETGEVVVDFGDREQAFPPILMVQNSHGTMSEIDPRKDLSLAYVITTHKSQGSEYKRLVYILNKSNTWMISRKNFYTGISRAREHVYLIADQRGLSLGVNKKA